MGLLTITLLHSHCNVNDDRLARPVRQGTVLLKEQERELTYGGTEIIATEV